MSLFSNTGKSNIYLIFVILAILTSLITKLTAKYEKDIVFRVIVEDHEDEKFIYKKSHDSLMLRVRGYGFNLAKYYLESPELRISVKKLKEVNNTFIWSQSENFNETKQSFDPSIELKSISEDSILFYFDKFISAKIPIKPNININYVVGYDSFYSPVLSVDSVNVLGPNEVIEKIKYINTEPITLDDVKSDISIELSLENKDSDIFYEIEKTSYDLKVNQYTEETIDIPVNVLSNGMYNFNYYPKELSVKYIVSIEDYNKINSTDFRIDCVFDKNQSFLVPEITKKPDFVKNAKLSSSKIQLIIIK
tara:strand:- start:4336 stop:5256 length:921 start_codon:yes stop_codon:yes gene_type:complete